MKESPYKTYGINFDKPWNTIILKGSDFEEIRLKFAGKRAREIIKESVFDGNFGATPEARRRSRRAWQRRRSRRL
ncbi:MAG: hypothetical protein U9Q63_02500 [Patescibacteria group bacterium]|nr:hypothetical protein [Patescibacteria group bacterium]